MMVPAIVPMITCGETGRDAGTILVQHGAGIPRTKVFLLAMTVIAAVLYDRLETGIFYA
ncbi:MAG TPA: hypothetical protein VIK69_00835 [Methylophilaceae bacterium]|jgi:hypothetical protein